MDRPNDSYIELRNLGVHVLGMLKKSMDSFARLDTNASKEVIIEDEKVDQEYEQILKHGLDNMKENPEEVKRLMNVTWAQVTFISLFTSSGFSFILSKPCLRICSYS